MEYRVLRPLTHKIPSGVKDQPPTSVTWEKDQVVDIDLDEAERMNTKSAQPIFEPVDGLKAERVQRTDALGAKDPDPAPKAKAPARKKAPAPKAPAKATPPDKAGGSAPPKE